MGWGWERQEEEGRESRSKGHSCRGLRPRVEELEPWNVPQSTLRKERKGKGTGLMCGTAEPLRMFVWAKEGTVLHLCQSYPPSGSTLLTSASLSPSQAHWQRSAIVHKTPLHIASPCLLTVWHSLSCERCDLWMDSGNSECVCNCTVMVKSEPTDIYQASQGCH